MSNGDNKESIEYYGQFNIKLCVDKVSLLLQVLSEILSFFQNE